MDADRILDAAGALFAEQGVAAVEMKDIARAAGCSRATLYRCFDSRGALHAAYVRREATAAGKRLAEALAEVDDPRRRLLAGMTGALSLVRENPALAAWFSAIPLGVGMAEESELVIGMAAAFLDPLRPPERESAVRRARWLVRMLTSLLISPGRDANDENAMLEEFCDWTLGPHPGEAVQQPGRRNRERQRHHEQRRSVTGVDVPVQHLDHGDLHQDQVHQEDLIGDLSQPHHRPAGQKL